MRIIKFDNSAVVIATETTAIAVDVGKDVPEVDVTSMQVDAVLVSHVHPDHFDRANVERLARPVFAPPEVAEALSETAVPLTRVVPGSRYCIGDLEIIPWVVDHGPISYPILNLGFEIATAKHRVWFAGDIARDTMPLSDNRMDVVLVPVGGGKVFEPQDAVAYSRRFTGATIIPIHFDHSMRAFLAFVDLANAAGLDVLPLGTGEETTLGMTAVPR